MTNPAFGALPLATLLWQPDLFNRRIRRGPMRTIWYEHAPEEIQRLRRKLLPQCKLVLHGRRETDGPFGDEQQVYFWFRHTPKMTACALCIEVDPLDQPATIGLPRPALAYLHPSSADQQTLVRWLVADYVATRPQDEIEVEKMGQFDLTGIVEAWAGLAHTAGGHYAN